MNALEYDLTVGLREPQERKRRGRPPILTNPERVLLSLSAEDYDRLDAEARAEGISVPEVIRRYLRVANQ